MSDLKTSIDPRLEDGPVLRRLEMAVESITLALACLAPWAYGAVDAWAELGLDVGIVLLALLSAGIGGLSRRRRHLVSGPSVLLAGLVVLALVQAVPLPAGLLRRVSPATASLRADLAPSLPQTVSGDSGPAIAPPSATVSLDPDATLHTAAQLAAAWVVFLCVLRGSGGPAPLRRFGAALAVNAVLLTLFSLVQALSWNGKIYWLRPSVQPNGWFTGGPFFCKNHLGAYLNLGLGFASGFFLASSQDSARRRYASVWSAYAVGLIVVGILASHARGAFLAMAGAGAMTLVLLRPRSLHVGAGLAILGITIPVFLVALGSASPFERVASILDSGSTGFTGRTEIWKAALEAWRAHPIWGTGLGSFPAATAPFFHHNQGYFYTHAEDEYLHLLVEGGLVGLVLGVGALVAIARLGLRALAAAPSPRQRAMLLGALFGGLALALQCLGDFPLHIPGVGVAAVILSAHLCRLGLDARRDGRPADPAPSRLGRAGAVLIGLIMLATSLAALRYTAVLAEAERRIEAVGLPLPGTTKPKASVESLPRPELERRRDALVRVLGKRPNWAEGYLLLGNTYLGLYKNLAAEWIGDAAADPARPDVRADPLWLHDVLHSATDEQREEFGGPLEHEPVVLYLVPAARCFLEARRCCPVLALPHARLASLDYLLAGGDPGPVHVRRALRLAGADSQVLALAAQLAVQLDDLDLASRCWKRYFATEDRYWKGIATAAAFTLPPDTILDAILPAGAGNAVRFADELGTGDEARTVQVPLLKAALARLPKDPRLSPGERLWIDGQVRARLGERDLARKLMHEALEREPTRIAWREESVRWLLQWGEYQDAYRQALIGTQLNPEHPDLRRELQAALQLLNRSTPTPPSPGG